MPELPDIAVYVRAVEARVVGATLKAVRLGNPFLLRSVDPPVSEVVGRKVLGVRRLGKRIVLALEGELFVVLHLMIAGRLHWKATAPKPSARGHLAVLEFDTGALTLTEAGTKRRATLHLVRGESTVRALDRGGLEVLDADLHAFEETLGRENRTLKRALTDPRLFSGIGNSYSDEILHRARLSPVTLTSRLTPEDAERLYTAIRAVLNEWTERLEKEAAGGFPEKVTAFRPEMAVHGRYNQPCPSCGTPVQRIVYAENESNYCPTCQTGGKLLADRALSRLMRREWPRTLEELEEQQARRRDRMME
jgi:formamidopyrimidine-DNA glycosylase